MIAPEVPPVPVISNVTSPEANASVGLPGGITSSQASSLHSNGAVNTLALVKAQNGSCAEKAAVTLIWVPLVGIVIPVNVYGEVKPTAETDVVMSPVRFKVPEPGDVPNVTVISTV